MKLENVAGEGEFEKSGSEGERERSDSEGKLENADGVLKEDEVARKHEPV